MPRTAVASGVATAEVLVPGDDGSAEAEGLRPLRAPDTAEDADVA